MSRLPVLLLVTASLSLGLAGCGKNKIRTLANTSLDAQKPLMITFDDDIDQCDEQLCLLGLSEELKLKGSILEVGETGRLVRLFGDGSYTMYEGGETEEQPEPEEPPENWQETEEKSREYWREKSVEKTMGNATKEISSGTLAETDGKKVLEIAPDILPAADFFLYTNGHFGAMLDGEPLGSPTRFGVTKISR